MTTSQRRPRPSRVGHLIHRLWKPMLGLTAYSYLAIGIETLVFGEDLRVSSELQALVSFFLGSLMAMRVNTSFSHWWEARTLWGRLVNEERNVALYVATLSAVPWESRRRMMSILIEFPEALMVHLRCPQPAPEHRPCELSRQAFAEIEQWKQRGWIDRWEWSRLASVLEHLLRICGGCERIRSSLLTRSYRGVVLACVVLYLMAAPFVLHCRWWTVPLVLVGGAIFLCLEQVATDIEEPFGTDPEDIPMERLCDTIAATVTQVIEHPNSPVGHDLALLTEQAFDEAD